jgi:hypothetical protein
MPNETTAPSETTAQRWRCPPVLRAKAFLIAAANGTVALVFFPLWFAVPVTALLAAFGLGVAVGGATVLVDEDAGRLTLRLGPLVRRIRLADVTGVMVERGKVSIRSTRGPEISFFAWRQDPLDALLRVPVVAGDIGHAISRAAALAQAADAPPGTPLPAGRPGRDGRTLARTRSRLATGLLGTAGALAIVAALLVRVHWHNPVLTVLGVLIALVLGISGLLYLLVALWIALTGRSPRASLSP